MQTSVNPAPVLHSGFLADKDSAGLKIKPLSNWPNSPGPAVLGDRIRALDSFFCQFYHLPCAPHPLGSGRLVNAQVFSFHTTVTPTAGTSR